VRSKQNSPARLFINSTALPAVPKCRLPRLPREHITVGFNLLVHYLEVASGSIPLFLIVSEARAEARKSLQSLVGAGHDGG
jgi:hypothetical protein